MDQMTFKYRAATSRHGYRRIKNVLLLMGHLRNALIRHREAARGSHRRAFSLKVQNAHLTDLHRHLPEYNTCARRLLESVASEVNKSYRSYFNNEAVGKPQTASPYGTRTLEISEPSKLHVKFGADEYATIHIKGLPTIKFKADHRLPHDEQPRVIRITMLPRRLVVSLTYKMEPAEMQEPVHESVGIDPGVVKNITAVSDDGTVLQVPGFTTDGIEKTRRRLKKRMQRQRDAALRDGRARFITQKSRTGKTKRRFRWTEKPSNSYLRSLAQLRKVEQKRQDSMRGYQHRLSHQLVKDHQIICMEDSKIRNMTRSAKGTIEQPGKNVRQKAGLNKAILAQGWYGLRLKMDYKSKWYGRQFILVPAHHTSQACSGCGHIEPRNRTSQSVFRCLDCGLQLNADVNAAQNIRRQGLEILARAGNISLGVPPETHRVNKRNEPRRKAGRRCTHELALQK